MKIGLEYIKYLWKLKSKYRSDSSFSKDFFNKCLQIELDVNSRKKLKELFTKLKDDNRIIEIQDFGAGSKKLGNKRKVSTILKTSSSKGKYGKLLYQMTKHYQFKNCLEFGTSLGIGTTYLHLGNPNSKITTIEACENTRKVACENLTKINNVVSVGSTFDDFIACSISTEPANQSTIYDFVFIDGHHDGTALLSYIDKLETLTDKETIYVLDDIRWSDSMFDAWNQIKNKGNFEVIDLFRVGIIKRK